MSGDDPYHLPSAPAAAKRNTLIASERDRPDVVGQREAWLASQELIDPAKVVFIHETCAKADMTRTYGRSKFGTRALERTPWGRWQMTTFLGGCREVAVTRRPTSKAAGKRPDDQDTFVKAETASKSRLESPS